MFTGWTLHISAMSVPPKSILKSDVSCSFEKCTMNFCFREFIHSEVNIFPITSKVVLHCQE